MSKKERKQIEKFEKVKTKLENQTFSYSAKWSIYKSRRVKIAQAAYSYVKLNQNTINSSLIYSGAQASSQGSQYAKDVHDSLIELSLEISNYSITYKDNGKTIIVSFSVKQNSENYQMEIMASQGKSVILTISSNKRESVKYEGSIR